MEHCQEKREASGLTKDTLRRHICTKDAPQSTKDVTLGIILELVLGSSNTCHHAALDYFD
jgi:hypothetical protein